jgi:hypothetical protein
VQKYSLEGGYGNRLLEILVSLFPEHAMTRIAWNRIKEALKKDTIDRKFLLPHPQTYLAITYSAIESEEIVTQAYHDLDWLARIDNHIFDEALTRHLSSRLRRDSIAAQNFVDAIISPNTSDVKAAELASLLSASVPLTEEVRNNLELRMSKQTDIELAPIVKDRVFQVSLSVRNLIMKVLDISGTSC